MSYRLTAAHTLHIAPADALHAVLRADLRRIFDRRHLMLAPVSAYDVTPDWPAEGERREVHASDGSSFVETITLLEPPWLVEYCMTDIGGPLGLLATEIGNRWTFDPHPLGTRVVWTWEIAPPHCVSSGLEPVIRPAWGRYARRALRRLETITGVPGAPR